MLVNIQFMRNGCSILAVPLLNLNGIHAQFQRLRRTRITEYATSSISFSSKLCVLVVFIPITSILFLWILLAFKRLDIQTLKKLRNAVLQNEAFVFQIIGFFWEQ